MRALTDYMTPLVSAPLLELDGLADLMEGTTATAMRTAPTFTCVPAVLDGPGTTAPTDAGPWHRFRDAAPSAGHGGLPRAWGDPELPLVYVTFGSVAARLPGLADLYPAILGAFADRPVRVLLTTGVRLRPLGPGAGAGERPGSSGGGPRWTSCRTRRRWSVTAGSAPRWLRWPPGFPRLVAEPSYGDRARAVADEMAALPPVDDAVVVLERIASS